MRHVWLDNHASLLLQHLAEAPLGKQALTRGNRNGGAARNRHQRVYVLRLARLLDKEWVVRLQFATERNGHGRADPPVEVDGNVNPIAHGLPQRREALDKLGDLAV